MSHRSPRGTNARARRTALGVRALITVVFLMPILAGVLGVLLPAIGILPLLGRTSPSLEPFTALVQSPGVIRSLAIAAASAFVATALSVALTAAVLCASLGSRALAIAERLLAPILAVPHAAAALGLAVLIAPSGLIMRALSPWATGLTVPPDVLILRDPFALSLTASLIIKETPFLFLMALAALPQVKPVERLAIARSLGWGRMAGSLHAVWPLVYHRIRLPVLAVLAFAASVVDMALILGPTRPPTLAVRILDWFQSPDLTDWLTGAAGATALLVLIVCLIAVWRLTERGAGALLSRVRLSGMRFERDRLARIAVLALVAALTGALLLSVCGLLVQSAAGYWPFPDTLPATVRLAFVTERFASAAPILVDTLIIAAGATLITLVLALVLLEADRYGAPLPPVLYAALLVPQVAFLFGLNILMISVGITPGLVAVLLAHVLFTLPYTLIALAGPWRALDPGYETTAAMLGHGFLRRLVAVRLPMLAPAVTIATALSFAVSAALYLPTQLIASGRVATVTTEAVAAAAGGDRRAIGFWATLQLVLPFLAFALARAGPALAFRNRRAMRPARLSR